MRCSYTTARRIGDRRDPTRHPLRLHGQSSHHSAGRP
nr:MAG TPA: hypothetical protein [Caudoviricetes sp.]